ncbi:MAG: hypothetical protein CEN90_671 [Parcubacteria group bacterium Licking1014_17]|nr:MAG: hypothetical protein CEN90_671 [Parcubacteria group bacterium Licking1014_17]
MCRKEMTPEKFYEELAAGCSDFTDVIIIGNILLSDRNIKKSIIMVRSRVTGRLGFQSLVITGDLNLSGSRIAGDLLLDNCRVSGKFSVKGARVKGRRHIADVQCKEYED